MNREEVAVTDSRESTPSGDTSAGANPATVIRVQVPDELARPLARYLEREKSPSPRAAFMAFVVGLIPPASVLAGGLWALFLYVSHERVAAEAALVQAVAETEELRGRLDEIDARLQRNAIEVRQMTERRFDLDVNLEVRRLGDAYQIAISAAVENLANDPIRIEESALRVYLGRVRPRSRERGPVMLALNPLAFVRAPPELRARSGIEWSPVGVFANRNGYGADRPSPDPVVLDGVQYPVTSAELTGTVMPGRTLRYGQTFLYDGSPDAWFGCHLYVGVNEARERADWHHRIEWKPLRLAQQSPPSE